MAASGGETEYCHGWLLALPLLLAIASACLPGGVEVAWSGLIFAACLYALWIVRSLLFTFKSIMPQYGRTVSGLLAGIVLLDFLLAANQDMQTGMVFFLLFGLAMLFQRCIPAT